MAYDKVIDSSVLDAGLTTIADAIRAKGGTTGTLTFPAAMAEAIVAIEVGGGNETLNGIIDRSITEISNSEVTSISSYAFYNYSSLISANFPNVTSIGNSAFSYCKALISADFPNVTSIGNSAFYYCDTLTTADFPNVTSIGNSAFYRCSSLTTADFPNVTSIGNSAFYYCDALTSVDFPNVTSISWEAFRFCSNLTALILRRTAMAKLSNTDALNATPIASGTGYIYVPSALVASYQSATNWSTYSAQFRALEDYTVDGTITGELDPNKI